MRKFVIDYVKGVISICEIECEEIQSHPWELGWNTTDVKRSEMIADLSKNLPLLSNPELGMAVITDLYKSLPNTKRYRIFSPKQLTEPNPVVFSHAVFDTKDIALSIAVLRMKETMERQCMKSGVPFDMKEYVQAIFDIKIVCLSKENQNGEKRK